VPTVTVQAEVEAIAAPAEQSVSIQ
jgi:hypothetical protein